MKNMQSVSDDDFDKLFQSKLYSYEAEPTDAVWPAIADQLNTGKKGRVFPVLRVAAASMAAMIGLGIWLAETKEPMRLSGVADSLTVAPGQQVAKVSAKAEKLIVASKPEREVPKKVEVAKVNVQVIPKVSGGESVKSSLAKSVAVSKKEMVDEPRSLGASVETKGQPTSNTTSSKEAGTLALAADTEIETEMNEPLQKQKKIKSVGSLVNFVVSKVDKRKNKIIEFEDGDEGTMVSGLNLGPIKFKAKE